MKASIITAAAVTVLFVAATIAQAQISASIGASTPSMAYHDDLDYYYPTHDGYWWHHGGGTIAGSYLRGWGYAVRSLGEYNLLNSMAARHNQEAYSRALDNQVKKTDTYFDMRQLNAEYRARERGPVQTAEQINSRARAMAPKRLTTSQLESTLGTINWPASLEGEEFAAHRAELEQLFRDRAATGAGADSPICGAVEEVCRQMRAQLDEQVSDMRPMDFIAGKKFIDGLKTEARYNTDPNQALVANAR